MRLTIAWMLLLLVMTTTTVRASAQQPSAPAETAHGYKWKSLPVGNDIARFYPDGAQQRSLNGAVLLGCNVEADGHLSGCNVYVEQPRGAEFGKAALAMSGLFQLEPGTFEHSLPVPNRIAIPLSFNLMSGSNPGTHFGFGSVAALLSDGPVQSSPTPAAGLSCYSAATNAGCKFHSLTWTDEPDMMATMVSVLKAGKTQGLDVAICSVTDDRSLSNCKVMGPATKALLDTYLPAFKAPLKADDGTAVANGLVAIEFDWGALSTAAQAMKPDGTGALPTHCRSCE